MRVFGLNFGGKYERLTRRGLQTLFVLKSLFEMPCCIWHMASDPVCSEFVSSFPEAINLIVFWILKFLTGLCGLLYNGQE